MKRNIQNKGVTLIALVVTLIILIILAGVSISMIVGDNGIITEAQKAAKQTEEMQVNSQSYMNDLQKELEEKIEGQVAVNEDMPNAPEQIDGMTPIKFTEPTDTEMGSYEETSWTDSSWYNYKESKWANTKSEDGSMWVWIPRYAYKITYNNPEDRSQGGTIDVKFLIGTTDEYYDSADGKLKTAKRQTTADETVDTTSDFYVHPAFTNETSINFANGGWDKELTGIYVAKFEAGFPEGNNTTASKKSSVSYSQDTSWVRAVEAGTSADSTQTARNWLDGIYGETETKISYPVFQPLTYSMNYINENDAYNISKAMNESGNIYGFTTASSDTHLIKSSEWGMISYLSYSQYGTNGNDIAINNANLNSGGLKRETSTAGKTGVYSVYGITGMTQGLADGAETVVKIDEIKTLSGNTPTTTGSMYAWNQKGGVTASSTGNMTGVYDLSGGTWERTASYVANNHKNLLTYGESVAYNQDVLKTASTKYTMVYPYDSSVDNSTKTDNEENLNAASNANYKKNTKIYGDAIRETSTAGTGTSSWQDDYSYFAGLYYPFVLRGGHFWDGSHAGRFFFTRANGHSSFTNGFRPVVVPVS